jgi:serine/threonine protein phosphatase PrpC
MRTITSHASHQGKRAYQEDRTVISAGEDGLLLGVFDGHGGSAVSEFCHKNLLNAFNSVADNPDLPDMPAKMYGMFNYLKTRTNEIPSSGSTASIVFIPSTLDRAYVGILGDSPVVIREADGTIWVSPDHNVRNNPSEVEAAKLRGGTTYGGYLYPAGLAASGIQMTRSLGDSFMGDVLNRTPQLFESPLGPNSFVLVASDGLIDPGHHISNPEDAIVALIDRGAKAGNLVKYAIDVPTGDNVSAILVRIVA